MKPTKVTFRNSRPRLIREEYLKRG
jgi:hypothetical protein